uniref:Uncharacterized protein n=1 Tax=Nonomuraea gerenzanensis TaxID=93944 RepID=A0A1M4E650_9ACTN|nr:hypothetical protein BN4615_P3714 [Nonomuraea gerenzanensis]
MSSAVSRTGEAASTNSRIRNHGQNPAMTGNAPSIFSTLA